MWATTSKAREVEPLKPFAACISPQSALGVGQAATELSTFALLGFGLAYSFPFHTLLEWEYLQCTMYVGSI